MTEPVGDGEAPVLAEAARRDSNTDRRLTPFVLAQAHEPHHALHIGTAEPRCDDLSRAQVALDIGLQDRIEHWIGRQAVLVGLAGTQFRRRRALDYALWYDARNAVAVAREPVDHHLGQVFQYRKTSRHVAVKRRVTGSHLALVAGREHDRAGLVGEGHQQRAADARLQILFRDVFAQPFELLRQRIPE